MKYLIVECTELGDQWECDADRTPICVTDNYSKYDKRGYEIYEIQSNGKLKLIRHYDKVSKKAIYVCIWNNAEESDITEPDKIKEIASGNRRNVTKSMIKKVKQEYHFSETVDEIASEINCCGCYAEEIDGKWVSFGEGYDDYYPLGY